MLSVIVTNYNNEDYIEKCLNSIINQTYKDIEIIVVDDGSKDNSVIKIKEICKNDERLRFFQKQNEGAASGRAFGISKAKGEYVTFPDSDDWLELDAYEKMMKPFENYDLDLVCNISYIKESSSENVIVENNIEVGLYENDKLDLLKNKIFDVSPALWLKVFKTSYVKPYIMAVNYETKVSNDMAASYPAILNSDRVYCTNELSYHYRVGHKGTSSLKSVQKLNSYFLTFRAIYEQLKKMKNYDLIVKLDCFLWDRVHTILENVYEINELKEISNLDSVVFYLRMYPYSNDGKRIVFTLMKCKLYILISCTNRIRPFVK